MAEQQQHDDNDNPDVIMTTPTNKPSPPALPSPTTYLPSSRYNVLVEFAHRHLDFQRAELESILSMNGITLTDDKNDRRANDANIEEDATCRVIPLPDRRELIERRHRRAFLVLSFAVSPDDDDALLVSSPPPSTNNASTTTARPTTISPRDLFTILSRCILIRAVVELWSAAPTLPLCAGLLERRLSSSSLEKRMVERRRSRSWKMTVHTLGERFTREEQNEMRREFSFLPLEGEVAMEGNEEEYVLIREVEVDEMGSPIAISDERHPHHPRLLAVYFGRILGGVRDLRKGQLNKISLKTRKYLGPTSMDAELSVIMSNLGQVKKGSFCFDPFVGTGSILLTCASQGAYCFGTDIDIRVLRGKGDDETIMSNFDQFDLPRPELLRSDNSLYPRHFRSSHPPLYDAIVTDPPYGIRAGARRCGVRPDASNPTIKPVPDDRRHDHIARTRPYNVADVMADLLDVAARTLVMGGRLVYVMPSEPGATALPRHECLTVVGCCYQPLQMTLGRRMVVMAKTKDYDEMKTEWYKKDVWAEDPDGGERCARIRERLMEEAKKKPGYEVKAAIRKKKRKMAKEERKRMKMMEREMERGVDEKSGGDG